MPQPAAMFILFSFLCMVAKDLSFLNADNIVELLEL